MPAQTQPLTLSDPAPDAPDAPCRVLFLTSHALNSSEAGNLVYVRFLLDIVSGLAAETTVVVDNDRFSGDALAIRPGPGERFAYHTPFSRRLLGREVLSSPKAMAKTMARRAWRALPSPLRSRVAAVQAARLAERTMARRDGGVDLRPAVVRLLADAIGRMDPTHLILVGSHFAAYLDALPAHDARVVMVCYDLTSRRHADAAARGLAADMEWLSETEEMARLARADAVIAIQRHEADRIRAAVPGRVVLVPYVSPPAAAVAEARGRDLLFVGSGGVPNVTGLRWFLDAVMPRIAAAMPGTRLDAVGAVGDFLPRARPDVTFHGRVEDVAGFYRRAGVVVVPLRVGSGLKIKLVEALAAGAPCVTTPVGAQGLEEGSGTAFLVADDPDAFADRVVDLLRDDARRLRLGIAAAAFSRRSLDRGHAAGAVREALRAPRLVRPAG